MKFNNTYLILFTGMILWGLYPIFTHRYIVGLNPMFLVGISTLIASVPFIIQLIIKKELSQLFSLKILNTLIFVALFTAVGYSFLFIGTKLTSGTNTGLLLQIEPIYSLILGVIFLGEIIRGGQILATLLMVFGAMIIVYKGGSSVNLGDILILLSPLTFQISHLIGKRLLNKKVGVTVILAGRQFFGGVMLLLFTFITNKNYISLFSYHGISVGFFLGIITSIISLCWYTSIKKIPVSVASSFIPLTALVSLVASAVYLKEVISIQQYIGFVLIVGGMLWQTYITNNKV